MKEIIKKCPVCGQNLTVRKLECGSCGTEINGKFGVERSQILNDDDWKFVGEFINCEGNFRLLSEKLDLSYPTLKVKLSKIKKKLNVERERDEVEVFENDVDFYISLLERGEISVDEVIKKIKRRKI